MIYRPLKVATALALAASLTGCAMNAPLVTPPTAPRLDPPDAAVTQPCADPVKLPPGEMVQRDIERYWRTDRLNLVKCGGRQRILADYIQQRDSGLAASQGSTAK